MQYVGLIFGGSPHGASVGQWSLVVSTQPPWQESKGTVAKYINTSVEKADILTKGLPPTQFEAIRKLLMGW
jgi:hypothetical protein